MKLLQFLYRYFFFLLKSRKKYSSKSTFILRFLNIIKDTKNDNNADSIKIENLRKQLSKSNKKINIIDFGAGSKIKANV